MGCAQGCVFPRVACLSRYNSPILNSSQCRSAWGAAMTKEHPVQQPSTSGDTEVFISYSSADRPRVLDIADQLEAAGVPVWIDRNKSNGGRRWDEQIVRAIRDCKVVLLMCSQASMRSRNVKQEIQLAWRYNRPYLP